MKGLLYLLVLIAGLGASEVQPLELIGETKFIPEEVPPEPIIETTIIPEEVITEEAGWNRVEGIATAYSPYENFSGIEADADCSVTSIGLTPAPGIWAVDPAMIAYGSDIRITYPDGTVIEGIAGDTGGALRDNGALGIYHIDVFHWTYEATINHGVQDVIIEFR